MSSDGGATAAPCALQCVRVFCPVEFHPERLKFYMAAFMSVCAFALGVYLLVAQDANSPFGASLAMASLAAWVRMPSLPAADADEHDVV